MEALAGGVGSEILGETIDTLSYQGWDFGYECKSQKINPIQYLNRRKLMQVQWCRWIIITWFVLFKINWIMLIV